MMSTATRIGATSQDVLRMEATDLRSFFDRLATGDYHNLAKELNITPKPLVRPTVAAAPPPDLLGPDGEISLDSLDALTFEPTVEGLERAVSLLHTPASPTRQTAEQEEAFQFTFRLMIHKLYSIREFAAMVDDVVRTSQERFQSLPPSPTTTRRASYSNSYAYAYPSDGESFMSAGSPSSPSEATWPSSPSLRSVDQISEPGKEQEDLRPLKKRCIGRRLSVVDPDADADADKSDVAGWVYDSAVASVESPTYSPSYASFIAGLPPMSPAAESPSMYGYDEADGSSRKRRYSLLAARGF
ncbi:hypothetical protein VTO73DRAFT_2610 [Trametes versicolor]